MQAATRIRLDGALTPEKSLLITILIDGSGLSSTNESVRFPGVSAKANGSRRINWRDSPQPADTTVDGGSARIRRRRGGGVQREGRLVEVQRGRHRSTSCRSGPACCSS